jgi:hypothetical protein
MLKLHRQWLSGQLIRHHASLFVDGIQVPAQGISILLRGIELEFTFSEGDQVAL